MISLKNVTSKLLALSKQSAQLKLNRTFLTESYYCYDKWDQFLTSDLMKKVSTVEAFSIQINDRLFNKQLVTPLDMDLLAAKLVYINNFQELEFIENIFATFRKTQASLYVRDSMHYSFIRAYMDINQTDRLLQILKLKYKYGIFADQYTANMLMDVYLKEKDSKRAALVAHEVMLQEYDKNELTLTASLLSCMKYLSEKHEDDSNVQESKESSDDGQKKEKRLVYFLRKEYNDEHFDLKSVRLLSGKTVYFASSNLKTADSTLTNSLKIYGLLVLKKYDKALSLLEELIVKNNGNKLFSPVLDEFKTVGEKLSANESEAKTNENFLKKWTEIKALFEHPASDKNKQVIQSSLEDLVKQVESHLEKVKKTQIDLDIKSQSGLYEKWTQEQSKDLNEQLRNFEVEVKKEKILKQLEELEKKEERLMFFEKRGDIIDHYYGKGFPTEDPSNLPVEPEESEFKVRYERHFKPWPKYMNRPVIPEEVKQREEYNLESLRKIYLQNSKAQTTPERKLATKTKKKKSSPIAP